MVQANFRLVSLVSPNWGMVELDWCYKVMAEAPNPCIRRPTYLITKHFSILRCCEWAYWSNLTLFHFCAGGGGILRNLGYGWALLMLNSHGWCSKPTQIASHNPNCLSNVIYKSKWFSTLLCCGWAGPSIHWSMFVLVHMGGDITELVVWSSYVVRTLALTWGMVEPERCCKVMAEAPNQ